MANFITLVSYPMLNTNQKKSPALEYEGLIFGGA